MSGSRHSPEDSFSFKLSGLRERTVFVLGIFPPQYSPSSPFSCGTVRRRRMNAFLEEQETSCLCSSMFCLLTSDTLGSAFFESIVSTVNFCVLIARSAARVSFECSRIGPLRVSAVELIDGSAARVSFECSSSWPGE